MVSEQKGFLQGGRFTDGFARFLLRFRWPVLILLLTVTALFARQIPNIVIEISPEGMRLRGHPDTVYYTSYIEEFGSDEVILMEFWCENLFTSGNLSAVQRLTEEISTYDNVSRVMSLTSVNDVRALADGIEIRPFLSEIPETPAGLEAIRRQVHENPLYYGNLVSRDDRSTMILVELERSEEEFPRKRRELVKKVMALLASGQGEHSYEVFVGGFPVLTTVLPTLLMEDQRSFIPAILILLIITLYLTFRSFWGVLLPLLTVFMSVAWTMGFLVLCGKRVEIVTNVLPPLILVIAIADAVHIVAHYQEQLRRMHDKTNALVHATAYIFVPCLLTSLTTAIGFGSLMVSSLQGIHDLGLLAAFGVLAAFVVSITFVPILLSFLPPRFFDKPGEQRVPGLERGLVRLGAFNEGHKGLVIVLAVVLVLGSIAGAFRLKVETTLIKYLKADNPLVHALEHIEANLTGTSTLDVVFEFDEPEQAKEPKNLAAILDLQNHMKALPLVTHCLSVVDLLQRMHQVMAGGDPAAYRLPDTREEVAQYLLLYSMGGGDEDLYRYVDDAYQKAVLRARVKTCSSAEMERLIVGLKQHISDTYPRLSIRVTGLSVLVTDSIGALVRGQIQSLGLALCIIFLAMSLVFFSFRLGLISMLPNLIPILLTLGLMGWFGIPINTATAVISCVAIGIAVDDTIHYLTRFRKEYGIIADATEATKRSLLSTGRALVFTSVILTLGFFVLVFSNFVPIIYFGALTGVTMLSALVGDLVLLPVLLMLFKPLKSARDGGG